MDCVEEFRNNCGMKDSDIVANEGSVEKAIQVMANILVLQNKLSHLLGTLMKGMIHVGLI